MMDRWSLIRTGANAASWNMAFDEALLENAPALGIPTLRLYGWSEPAATFGYFQHYRDIESWTALRPLIRRPTGGGLVPHDADWTYSVVVPPNHAWYELRAEESYRRVHDWVAASFQEMRVSAELASCCAKEMPGRCFVGAEKFDVLADGRKIAGAAQKRNKFGLLIQGSIQPSHHDWKRSDWEKALLAKAPGIEWTELMPSPLLLERAAGLSRDKYSRTEYNQKR